MGNRRGFLKVITAATSAVAAALAGLPALFAFASPAFRRKRPDEWISLGPVARFQPELATKVDFAQTVNDAWVESRTVRNVWVYTDDGESFIVYNPRCTHLGCSYAYDKDRSLFQCPCHVGQFDVKTGAVVAGPPPRPLDRLAIKIEDGTLYAAYREL